MALPQLKVKVGAETSEAEAGLDRVASKAARMGKSMGGATRKSAAFSRGVQNASFQAADFAVQVGGGVDASRALAQQLPQLLGGFGVIGAVLGAVAAIAIPLRTAMQGLSQDGRDMTEVFGALQPVMQSIATSMTRAAEIMTSAAELIINNIDRIVTIGATAAALFGARWVAGFIAAKVATFSLSGALLFLRGAIIRTGVGALIVGLGELVFQFTRVAQAAGGFGNAVGLLWDVAKETFDRIKAGVGLVGVKFQIIINQVMFSWTQMLGDMKVKFGEFLDFVAGTSVGGLMGLEGGNAAAAGNELAGALGGINDQLVTLLGAESDLQGTLDAPFASIMKIKDLLAQMKDDDITLGSILGGSSVDADGGKGKSLDEKLTDQEKRIQGHFDRIRAISRGGLSDQLGGWGNYFNSLIGMTNSSNQKLLGIGKAFASAQALIDAWSAHNRVLADPTLPWFARIASAAQVLASGIGAVNAINSVGGSGGGATAAGGAAPGGGTAAPAQQGPLEARVSGFGADQFFTGDMVSSLFNKLQDEAGDRGVRVTFAQ